MRCPEDTFAGGGAAVGVPDEVTEAEPWLEALRLALEQDPRLLDYERSAWTAPLLGRYLLDTQGVSIPLPRLRGAIKELGYQWQHTRYVQTHPNAGPH